MNQSDECRSLPNGCPCGGRGRYLRSAGWAREPFPNAYCTSRNGLSVASALSNPPEMGPTTRQETSRCQYVSHLIDGDLVAGRQHIVQRQSQPSSLDSVTGRLTNG